MSAGSPPPPPLTLGTAGHVDHGKTALCLALTGTDTDRLAEEKRRGLSIELGFAPMLLRSGRRLSVVDVPGHERFVRTMVAGATGVDLFLMAVAADDGVMPQTREHAAVLDALDVRDGVVAVTKCDLADPARAMREVAPLLPDAERVAVSARTGAGLDELRAALDRVVGRVPGRAGAMDGDGEPERARLHVDRSFTVRGTGTVATGTLWSGTVAVGDRLEVLPRGLRVRARSVEVHDAAVERASAGQRVAIALAGVARGDVDRGDVVAGLGSGLSPSFVLDVELALRADVAAGARMQFHHGTRQTPGRVVPLGGAYWQLRLERPLVAAAGDRFVVRRIAPPETLGGGRILDPGARKHGASAELTERLDRLARGDAVEEDRPQAPRPKRPSSRPPALSSSALELEARLLEAGWEPPIESELGELAAELPNLRAAGRAVRAGARLHYHPEALAEVEHRLAALLDERGSVTVAELRDELGTSRKFAHSLLEHFDRQRFTRRVGDAHVARRGGRPRDAASA